MEEPRLSGLPSRSGSAVGSALLSAVLASASLLPPVAGFSSLAAVGRLMEDIGGRGLLGLAWLPTTPYPAPPQNRVAAELFAFNLRLPDDFLVRLWQRILLLVV
jgi:hypothetical protein